MDKAIIVYSSKRVPRLALLPTQYLQLSISSDPTEKSTHLTYESLTSQWTLTAADTAAPPYVTVEVSLRYASALFHV